jgi:hypothetical protein
MRFDVHGEHFAIYLLLLAIKWSTGLKMDAKSLQFFFEVQQWVQNPFNFSLKFSNGCKIPSIFL